METIDQVFTVLERRLQLTKGSMTVLVGPEALERPNESLTSFEAYELRFYNDRSAGCRSVQ